MIPIPKLSNVSPERHKLLKCRVINISTVIHFENDHHGSSGPLLIRTMSPKSKAMSPNFISGSLADHKLVILATS